MKEFGIFEKYLFKVSTYLKITMNVHFLQWFLLTLFQDCLGDMICFDNCNRQLLDILLFYLFQKQQAVVKLRCYSWLKKKTHYEKKDRVNSRFELFKNKTAILR